MSDISVSFEFFPPKSPEMEETLWRSVERLAPLAPKFVSVTYGAGGSTRERTHRTVKRIALETSLKPAAHLTCVDATREDVDAVAQDYWDAGIRHIVALRGDAPNGMGEAYSPTEGGYFNAAELTAGLKAIGDFEISVGCYPEKHPESVDWHLDIDLLKAKIDAGATRAITQFFFEADTYFRFLDHAHAAGITIPIVPGIMPILNFVSLQRIAGTCGAAIPPGLYEKFAGLENDADTRRLVAATVAAELVENLRSGGVQDFHFYTLNRAGLSYAVCHLLGLRPASSGQASSGKASTDQASSGRASSEKDGA